MIPNSMCNIGGLSDFEATISSTNPGLTCAPLCMSSIPIKYIPATTCPSNQEIGMCGLIAATNIANIVGHSTWSCTTLGSTVSNPCSPVWSGLSCNGSAIISIALGGIGVIGMVVV